MPVLPHWFRHVVDHVDSDSQHLRGLSAPFLSRCPPIELRALTQEHLIGFAEREGSRRDLPQDAVDAVKEVIVAIKTPHNVSLRSVIRMLDAVEQTINRPVLH